MTAPNIDWETAMDRFVIRENIKHYLKLLERTSDEGERARLCTLLADEQRKQKERDHEQGRAAMNARNVMTTKIISVPADMPTRDIVRLLLNNQNETVPGRPHPCRTRRSRSR
jgi:hypothetical protein